jgi:CheY-like chemotaxis protein
MRGLGSNRAGKKRLSAERSAAHVQPGKTKSATKKPNRRFHILLVEDHEPTRLALTQLLQHRRYKVTPAGSCAEARSLMKKNEDFYLLISDIGLPDGSGYDLMNEFQKKFGAKGIALTGHGTEEDITQSQKSGFTTHLTKPVRFELLEIALTVAQAKTKGNVFIKNGMPRQATAS